MEKEKSFRQRLILLSIGLLVGACLYSLTGRLHFDVGIDPVRGQMAAGITGFVAVLWLTEAIPMAATSLIPLAAFPLFGVVPTSISTPAYAHPILWMFFGGLVLALGIERWGLHRRIALHVIRRAGTQPSRLILGFMSAACFLSMWMNNTSTTLMLLPIALALVSNLRDVGAIQGKDEKNFSFALLVGVAYASSIGGIATPVGTAPNALFMSTYAAMERAGAPPVSFSSWCLIATPMVWVFLVIAWFVLIKIIAPQGIGTRSGDAMIKQSLYDLGPIRSSEKRMLALFSFTALLWITRRDIDFGSEFTFPGWWHLLPIPDAEYVGDGVVAVFCAILSFIIPSGDQKDRALMNWDTAKNIPWDILLLIGGGVCIAHVFEATGLAKAAALSMEPTLRQVPAWMAVVLVCTLMTFLTEFTSNAASTALMLPVMASSSLALGLDPRLLMLPATFSASCAFMLPIATPPNAIVFSSGRVTMRGLATAGFILNLVGVILISATVWFVAVPVWKIPLP